MTTSILFIGTVGEGVWRSTDGGATWCRSSKGMFVECDVRALVADPRRAGVLYAGTKRRRVAHGEPRRRVDAARRSAR